MQHITTRNPDVSFPFTDHTYALLADYAKAGRIPPLDPNYFMGDASSIVLASDGLIELTGSPSWDQCDAELIVATIELSGMHALFAPTVRAVLAFRRWLHETGRAGDAGIDTLEKLASEIGSDVGSGNGGTITMTSMTGMTGMYGASGAPAPHRPSRVERRAAAAQARRALRRR